MNDEPRGGSPPLRNGSESSARSVVLCVCVLAAGLGLASMAFLPLLTPAVASDQAKVKGSKRLSNERTLTRWAHPGSRAPIKARPTSGSRRIASTHPLTEDGFPEVYVVLRKWRSPEGRSWLEVRIPMRPNGRTGWLSRSALGPLYLVRTSLIVNRSARRATLYKKGRRVWRAPIGIGKSGTPTPAGRFWIREKFRVAGPAGMYGPMAFGTGAYSVLSDWPGGGVIGIHGTDRPGLIPGRPSHGCIRVRNPELRRLWRLMPVGTPVLIRR